MSRTFSTSTSNLGSNNISFSSIYISRQAVPWFQMFFLIFHCLRESRSGEHESRSVEKEKPLVSLDLNLTFMQTPAVKRVNLIIQKGTNGSLAIMCLSAAYVSTRVVRGGIF